MNAFKVAVEQFRKTYRLFKKYICHKRTFIIDDLAQTLTSKTHTEALKIYIKTHKKLNFLSNTTYINSNTTYHLNKQGKMENRIFLRKYFAQHRIDLFQHALNSTLGAPDKGAKIIEKLHQEASLIEHFHLFILESSEHSISSIKIKYRQQYKCKGQSLRGRRHFKAYVITSILLFAIGMLYASQYAGRQNISMLTQLGSAKKTTQIKRSIENYFLRNHHINSLASNLLYENWKIRRKLEKSVYTYIYQTEIMPLQRELRQQLRKEKNPYTKLRLIKASLKKTADVLEKYPSLSTYYPQLIDISAIKKIQNTLEKILNNKSIAVSAFRELPKLLRFKKNTLFLTEIISTVKPLIFKFINKAWTEKIVHYAEENILRKYPYEKNSHQSSKPCDVLLFLSKNGALAKFKKHYLSNISIRNESTIFPEYSLNTTFQHYCVLRKTIKIAIGFRSMSGNIAFSRLTINDKNLRYEHGPLRMIQAQWNINKKNYASLLTAQFNGQEKTITVSNHWGIIALLEQYKKLKKVKNTDELTLANGKNEIVLDVSSKQTLPFQFIQELRMLKIPKKLQHFNLLH